MILFFHFNSYLQLQKAGLHQGMLLTLLQLLLKLQLGIYLLLGSLVYIIIIEFMLHESAVSFSFSLYQKFVSLTIVIIKYAVPNLLMLRISKRGWPLFAASDLECVAFNPVQTLLFHVNFLKYIMDLMNVSWSCVPIYLF